MNHLIIIVDSFIVRVSNMKFFLISIVLIYVCCKVLNVGYSTFQMSLTEFLNRPNDNKEYVLLGVRLPNWTYNIYCVVGVFAFGAACSQLTTDVMKYTIGRLRPHFFYVCKPDVCMNGSNPDFIYNVNFTCTNELFKDNWRIMKEMRQVVLRVPYDVVQCKSNWQQIIYLASPGMFFSHLFLWKYLQ